MCMVKLTALRLGGGGGGVAQWSVNYEGNDMSNIFHIVVCNNMIFIKLIFHY